MNDSVFPSPLSERLAATSLIAVLVVDDAKDAVPVSKALIDGGVTAVEIALRTPAALDAADSIVRDGCEMTVGAGTVLTVNQVAEVKQRGVDFAVAPGLNTDVVDAARTLDLPFVPGISTPSDIEAAVQLGCRLLKLFPAEALGGLNYLKSIHGPYAHLGLQYIPLGGLHLDNIVDYLAEPIIHSIGGSWIAPRDLIRSRDWHQITENARAAMQLKEQCR